MSRDEIQE